MELDARLDAPVLCRVLTVAPRLVLTARVLKLGLWAPQRAAGGLRLARLRQRRAQRVTLASDQDNGSTYVDTDDPAVDEYFRLVAEDVNGGLTRCGIEPDSHFVLASVPYWRKTLTGWKDVFSDILDGKDLKAHPCLGQRVLATRGHGRRTLRDRERLHASIMTQKPRARVSCGTVPRAWAPTLPVVGGFRQKLDPVVDIKDGGLLPHANMARYQALARGISNAQATLERLAAVCDSDAEGAECNGRRCASRTTA